MRVCGPHPAAHGKQVLQLNMGFYRVSDWPESMGQHCNLRGLFCFLRAVLVTAIRFAIRSRRLAKVAWKEHAERRDYALHNSRNHLVWHGCSGTCALFCTEFAVRRILFGLFGLSQACGSILKGKPTLLIICRIWAAFQLLQRKATFALVCSAILRMLHPFRPMRRGTRSKPYFCGFLV